MAAKERHDRRVHLRVVAKVEWHPGELYPRVGFIVTNPGAAGRGQTPRSPRHGLPYNLVPYSRKVTNTSADAQRWFDRGLNWCFGYHHGEAVACFEKVLEADPNCAMAHWGIAYAVGAPNWLEAGFRSAPIGTPGKQSIS